MLEIRDGRLVFHYDAEEVWIEPWGPDGLRVRGTKERRMAQEDWALYAREDTDCEICFTEQGARVVNGKIRAQGNFHCIQLIQVGIDLIETIADFREIDFAPKTG